MAQIWPCGWGLAGSHHGAAVLEYLGIVDIGQRGEFLRLRRPHVDDASDCIGLHGRQREVVARIKADNSAQAALGLSAQ